MTKLLTTILLTTAFILSGCEQANEAATNASDAAKDLAFQAEEAGGNAVEGAQDIAGTAIDDTKGLAGQAVDAGQDMAATAMKPDTGATAWERNKSANKKMKRLEKRRVGIGKVADRLAK